MMGSSHANIEEESLTSAVRKYRKMLLHVHFADNDRLPLGMGAIDFKPAPRELIEMDYRGSIGAAVHAQGREPNLALAKGMNYLEAAEDGILR